MRHLAIVTIRKFHTRSIKIYPRPVVLPEKIDDGFVSVRAAVRPRIRLFVDAVDDCVFDLQARIHAVVNRPGIDPREYAQILLR